MNIPSLLISGIILESGTIASAISGATAVAGALATVPVAGWIVAAVILTGVAITATGIWFYSQAAAETHSPMELWAARSQFGTLKNDGEQRVGLVLDENLKLPRYSNLNAEMKGWYQAFFAPILLDSDQAKSIGLSEMESARHDNWFSDDQVEYVVLLPGFILGQSTWEGGLGTVGSDTRIGQTSSIELPRITVFGVEPACIATSAGLVLHYKMNVRNINNTTLAVEFKPNQGLDETAVAYASFPLKD